MNHTLLFLALLLSLTTLAFGQDGTLDTGFGGDGRVTTDFSGSADAAPAVAIQPDGKIIAAGSALSGQVSFALARYNADGSLDPTFDGDGRVILNRFGLIRSIALQPDGKIVAAGRIGNDFGLARFNADGSLDVGFGTGGELATDFFLASNDIAHSVALQPDGKIVAAGTARPSGGVEFFALARYDTDGFLDPTFDRDGRVSASLSPFGSQATAVAIQPDGKIIAAGDAGRDFALARFNPDGSLDATFGTNGQVVTDFGAFDSISDIVLQADGSIVAVGSTRRAGNIDFFTLARYTPDGRLDATFGTGGQVTGDAEGRLRAVVLQRDGKIVAAGSSGAFQPSDFVLVRYHTDGSLDATFGSGGTTTTDFGSSDEEANGLALQADGRIVASGFTGTDRSQDFALARYNVDGGAAPALCLDPMTAPSYAGGFVLNAAGTRAFIQVSAPAGAVEFTFYSTTNLTVANPETDPETGTRLTGLTRTGDVFSFAPGSEPTEAFFPITRANPGVSGVSFFLRVADNCDRSVDVDPAFTLTGVAADERSGVVLAQAAPNPTTGTATIRFSLDTAGEVTLALYDVLGREVVVLVDGALPGGTHTALFDGAALPSGLYLVRLRAGGQTQTRTLTLAR